MSIIYMEKKKVKIYSDDILTQESAVLLVIYIYICMYLCMSKTILTQ